GRGAQPETLLPGMDRRRRVLGSVPRQTGALRRTPRSDPATYRCELAARPPIRLLRQCRSPVTHQQHTATTAAARWWVGGRVLVARSVRHRFYLVRRHSMARRGQPALYGFRRDFGAGDGAGVPGGARGGVWREVR